MSWIRLVGLQLTRGEQVAATLQHGGLYEA